MKKKQSLSAGQGLVVEFCQSVGVSWTLTQLEVSATHCLALPRSNLDQKWHLLKDAPVI